MSDKSASDAAMLHERRSSGRLTFEEAVQGLKAVGLRAGDTVLVQSDASRLGRVDGARTREDILAFHRDAFQAVIGPEGTLAVCTAFEDYGRYGTEFHVESVPFPPWIFQRIRSPVSRRRTLISSDRLGLRGRSPGRRDLRCTAFRRLRLGQSVGPPSSHRRTPVHARPVASRRIWHDFCPLMSSNCTACPINTTRYSLLQSSRTAGKSKVYSR